MQNQNRPRTRFILEMIAINLNIRFDIRSSCLHHHLLLLLFHPDHFTKNSHEVPWKTNSYMLRGIFSPGKETAISFRENSVFQAQIFGLWFYGVYSVWWVNVRIFVRPFARLWKLTKWLLLPQSKGGLRPISQLARVSLVSALKRAGRSSPVMQPNCQRLLKQPMAEKKEPGSKLVYRSLPKKIKGNQISSFSRTLPQRHQLLVFSSLGWLDIGWKQKTVGFIKIP